MDVNLAQSPRTLAALDEISIGATALRQALDCLRIGITLYDDNERLAYVNRHFFYLFRRFPDADQLIGHSYDDLVRLEVETGTTRLPSGISGLEAYVAARRMQLSQGNFIPRDISLDDGRIIEIKIRRTPSGFIALWADATQARESHGRLASAVEMSTDAFAFWDNHDRLVMCNSGFARIHGRSGESALLGMSYGDLLEELLDRDLIELEESRGQFIARRMRAHQAPAGAVTLRLKAGTAFLIRERATPDGGRASVFTDITDRTRVEAAFAEQSHALEHANRTLERQDAYLSALAQRLDDAEQGAANAKQTFLRTMSHELKTPLNAIMGFSDLLRANPERASSAQIIEYADLIHRAGGNLLTMLNQILDLTKIAAGQFPLRRERLGVGTLFDQVRDMVGDAVQEKNLTVTIACPKDLSINGDHGALLNALGQVVHNAVSFTQTGGNIRLTASQDGAQVCLEVADNGPGVATERLSSLTNPFEQAIEDGTHHHGGAGLGLTLVKAIAEQHGGRLLLSSDRGKGFIATLRLPAG
ncbi:MAG: PAS-domain containing protein [Alphaproteobacteria bacterium]|nr:PAS-domain containing protein [Alphaproteobacteria bacterium]